MKKSNKKGFTIVELVIVIAVIAILAAVLIPTFSTVVKKANRSKTLQEVSNAYKVYVASVNYAGGDKANEKMFVEVDGYYVVITNGKAEVSDTKPTGDDFKEMKTTTNSDNETTLTEKSASSDEDGE